MTKIIPLGLASLFAALLVTGPLQGASATLRKVTTLDLPADGQGLVDHMIPDPAHHRLYAGHYSSNQLVVIDTVTNRIVAKIGNLKGVRSIALVPALRRGFSTNRGEDTIGIIDLKSNRLLRRIRAGHEPNTALYDPHSGLVYVGNKAGHTATLIDPKTEKIVATVPLGGTAEYCRVDPQTHLIYQNVGSASEVLAIDPRSAKVVGHYPVGPGQDPAGLALDARHGRLFVGCGNEKLLVLDRDTGKVITTLPTGRGGDFTGYDAQLRRIFVPNGDSATLTVIQQEGANRYRVLENFSTHPTAARLALDEETHRIYLVYSAHGAAHIDVLQAR